MNLRKQRAEGLSFLDNSEDKTKRNEAHRSRDEEDGFTFDKSEAKTKFHFRHGRPAARPGNKPAFQGGLKFRTAVSCGRGGYYIIS